MTVENAPAWDVAVLLLLVYEATVDPNADMDTSFLALLTSLKKKPDSVLRLCSLTLT